MKYAIMSNGKYYTIRGWSSDKTQAIRFDDEPSAQSVANSVGGKIIYIC